MKPPLRDRVTLIGASGHVGSEMSKAFPGAECPRRQEFDLIDPSALLSREAACCDLLIVCAGTKHDALIARTSEAQIHSQFAANLTGVIRCVQQVTPGMIERERGHIILLGSYAAEHPPLGQAAYATAKAGLAGYARELARQLGPSRIRVNVIFPGFLVSPMTSDLSEARMAEVRLDHVLPTMNTAAHVAKFAHFLHYEMPHSSGQVFNLDSRIV